jgi:hypothetical protein
MNFRPIGKNEAMRKGMRVKIDIAPLIASPEPSGTLHEGEVLEDESNGRCYFAPVRGSPLYISTHWIREVQGP